MELYGGAKAKNVTSLGFELEGAKHGEMNKSGVSEGIPIKSKKQDGGDAQSFYVASDHLTEEGFKAGTKKAKTKLNPGGISQAKAMKKNLKFQETAEKNPKDIYYNNPIALEMNKNEIARREKMANRGRFLHDLHNMVKKKDRNFEEVMAFIQQQNPNEFDPQIQQNVDELGAPQVQENAMQGIDQQAMPDMQQPGVLRSGGRNFKSGAAYKKWLAYGHASGEFAKTPGHQKVSIKGKAKRVKHQLGGSNPGMGNPDFKYGRATYKEGINDSFGNAMYNVNNHMENRPVGYNSLLSNRPFKMMHGGNPDFKYGIPKTIMNSNDSLEGSSNPMYDIDNHSEDRPIGYESMLSNRNIMQMGGMPPELQQQMMMQQAQQGMPALGGQEGGQMPMEQPMQDPAQMEQMPQQGETEMGEIPESVSPAVVKVIEQTDLIKPMSTEEMEQNPSDVFTEEAVALLMDKGLSEEVVTGTPLNSIHRGELGSVITEVMKEETGVSEEPAQEEQPMEQPQQEFDGQLNPMEMMTMQQAMYGNRF